MAYIREYPPGTFGYITECQSYDPVACEQALLFGRAKRVSRERARGRGPSLARSREARPNRRACSQAKDPSITFQNKPLISLVKLVVSIISVILAKREIAFDSLLSEGRLAFANNNIFSKGGRYCRNFSTVSRHFAAFVSEL